MAKISALPLASSIGGTDEIPIVQGGVTKRAPVSLLPSGGGGGAPIDSPAFTGTPTAPTPSPGDNDTSIATTAFVATAVGAGGAPLASPVFTGNPRAPTPLSGDNDTSIATTAFVTAAVGVGGVGGAPIASPAFTGNPTAPTPSPGDNDTSIATTAFVTAADTVAVAAAASAAATLYAPKASPVFTGNPTAPTPSPGDNDTSIATTAFVAAAVGAGGAPLNSPVFTGNPRAPTPSPGDSDTSIATTAFVAAAVAAGGGPGSGDLATAMQAAWAADSSLNWLGGDTTLTAPINLVANTSKFGFKAHLNGANIFCDFNDANSSAINIIVPVAGGVTTPGISVRNWEITGATFLGTTPFKGAIYMQCWTNSSWIYAFILKDIGCDNHSGHSIHASGSVFEFTVRDVISNGGLGLFRATERGMVASDPTGADGDRGLPSAMEIYGARCRDFSGDGIMLDSSTGYREPFDLTVVGGYIVTGLGNGVGVSAPAGINTIEGVGFENLNGGYAINDGYRGGIFKRLRGSNPYAGAQASPPVGIKYLIGTYQAGGDVVIEDCYMVDEGAGSGSKLGVIGGSGTVYLSRSGTSAALDGSGPTVKVAQYV